MVEDKAKLMARMGKKQLDVQLTSRLDSVPDALKGYDLALGDEGYTLIYSYDVNAERTGITKLLNDVQKAGLQLKDVVTRQSSLEDIFVSLVNTPEDTQ